MTICQGIHGSKSDRADATAMLYLPAMMPFDTTSSVGAATGLEDAALRPVARACHRHAERPNNRFAGSGDEDPALPLAGLGSP